MSIETTGTEWRQTETAVELSSCRNCGEHISPQFAKVFGDNDDTVYACTNCSTFRDLTVAATAHNSE